MIEILVGDIVALDVDCVVNAANASLLGGGGVDGAIHRAAGPELLAHCRSLGGCPPGDCKLTPGFALGARFIAHCVGPVWRGGGADEPKLLARCYRRAFALAREAGAASIAFPCISTGAYGYPREPAARVALGEMRAHQAGFARIVACCFSAADAEVYRRVAAEMH